MNDLHVRHKHEYRQEITTVKVYLKFLAFGKNLFLSSFHDHMDDFAYLQLPFYHNQSRLQNFFAVFVE